MEKAFTMIYAQLVLWNSVYSKPKSIMLSKLHSHTLCEHTVHELFSALGTDYTKSRHVGKIFACWISRLKICFSIRMKFTWEMLKIYQENKHWVSIWRISHFPQKDWINNLMNHTQEISFKFSNLVNNN